MANRIRRYVAIIADMVGSRELASSQRGALQRRFEDLIRVLNRDYRGNVVSKFVITLGDEFQGLLNTTVLIPDLIWRLEEDFPQRELRVGVGLGSLDTPIQKYAINIDGPALHAARAAVETAKKAHALGGVFNGFGQLDEVVNGIARLLWFNRARWTPSQRRIVNLFRMGMSQTKIADQLRIKRQVVSKQLLASGGQQYIAAERAWRIILRDYADILIDAKE